MPIAITNGLVATLDQETRILSDATILIENDKIVSIGHQIGDKTDDLHVIDAAGCLVLPGFTNAHSHSTEAWAKGRSDASALESWLASTFPPLDTLSDQLIRISALLCAAEMMKSGVTTVVDHFRQIPATYDSIGAVSRAYREAGLNAAIAIMLRDRAIPKERDVPALRHHFSCGSLHEISTAAIGDFHRPEQGISIMLGPSAPHRCSDALLEMIAELSAELNVRVHTHVDENAAQRAQAVEHYGCSSVRHLSEVGLLGPNVSLAHVTHADTADIKLLAESQTFVVHNPVSNARLGSGIAPLSQICREGVLAALGTDGAASNDSQSMFEVMKFAALLQMLSEREGSSAPAAVDIVTMATHNGGLLLGGGHGVLAPGARADVVVIRLDEAPLVPLNDIYRQIVFAGAGLRAAHVIAGGRHIVCDGKIMTFDEKELYRQANELRGRIYS
jgi:cytosine/adenosine deaminase-related metal-dependent hydrolase